MVGDSSEGIHASQTAPASLVDVLHQAPRLYELLPSSSRQLLSATCSHLHKWIRENVSCIDEIPHLAPKDWPNLAGVLLHNTADPSVYFDSKKLSNRKWHLDAQIRFQKGSPHDLMLLISLYDSRPQAESDLTPRQCKVLSQCADRVREVTCMITLVSQQQGEPEHHKVNTANSALCYLPRQLVSCLGAQPWPELYEVDMRDGQCGLACAQGRVRCSFPALKYLRCSGVSTAGLHELVQASWPHLLILDLSNSSFAPSAVTFLSTSSWCGKLQSLQLKGNVLGEEGVRAWVNGTICNIVILGDATLVAMTQ